MKKNQQRPKKAKTKSGARSGTATGRAASMASEASHDDATAAKPTPVIEGRAEETGKKPKSTNPFEFFQQVRAEGSKITWTSRNETLISSIMVIIMVLVMVVFFFVVDQSLRFGICNILPINCAVGS